MYELNENEILHAVQNDKILDTGLAYKLGVFGRLKFKTHGNITDIEITIKPMFSIFQCGKKSIKHLFRTLIFINPDQQWD